jgi:DNA-binding NtrC family response regulator
MVDRSRTTILIVDDLDSVRSMVGRMLVEEGFAVIKAGNGAEALALLRRQSSAVRLVLSDVVMPGMYGTELAGHIVREFPELPVVLMSAYGQGGMSTGMRNSIVPVLQKPLHLQQLLQIVGQVLAVSDATSSATPID